MTIKRFTITKFLIILLTSSAPLARAQQSSQQSILTADQYLQSADRYSSEKQYDKAVEAYKLAINLNPNLPAAYYGLGVAYVNMGRMPDALEPMRTAVRLAPTNANSHRVLGQILGHLQHFDDGLAEMYEARRLHDAPDYFYLPFCFTRLQRDRYGELTRLFEFLTIPSVALSLFITHRFYGY